MSITVESLVEIGGTVCRNPLAVEFRGGRHPLVYIGQWRSWHLIGSQEAIPDDRFPRTQEEAREFVKRHTVTGYPAAVDRAKFERERCPESTVVISPGW